MLQACQQAGVEVPHFCFHERLAIAGNCRMCLVEQEKAPKPIASCAMPVADGMVIHTDSEKAKKARHGVMEFLLINHPLDCPICDQGGECDLQDEAMAYGFDRGRYHENKRAVKDKDFGPLVETSMTRCIHCTRCIRFLADVAGVADLGATGRGENMEIGTYSRARADLGAVGQHHRSLPGRRADLEALCLRRAAVGAAQDRIGRCARRGRLAISASMRAARPVLRILPRLNEDVNEEWISDKTRFAVDGLAKRRLDRPYVRRDGKLERSDLARGLRRDRARA